MTSDEQEDFPASVLNQKFFDEMRQGAASAAPSTPGPGVVWGLRGGSFARRGGPNSKSMGALYGMAKAMP